jgi:hypothetical protein
MNSLERWNSASENVVIVTERTLQRIRTYLCFQIGTGVYQDDKCVFEVRPSLVNAGQTPAYKVKYTAKVEVLPFPLPSDYAFPALDPPVSVFGILAPRADFTISAIVTLP